MTPSVANLKTKIASYLNRAQSSFVNGAVDNLLEAMNDARRTAQLRYDFNHLKTRAFVSIPAAGVNWQTGATVTPGGAALPLKTIKEVWSYTTQNGVYSKNDQIFLESSISDDYDFNRPSVQLSGPTMYVRASGSASFPISYMVEGVQWLTDLTGAETNDFFCDRGGTWLTYQTIQNLNLYLKEDSRVAIADSVVQRAWFDFIAWDGNITLSNNATMLE